LSIAAAPAGVTIAVPGWNSTTLRSSLPPHRRAENGEVTAFTSRLMMTLTMIPPTLNFGSLTLR